MEDIRQGQTNETAKGKHVFIELCSACNFDCDFCPYHLRTRPSGVMPLERLHRVMMALTVLPKVDYVMLSSMGEPLLHPEFEEACRIVKSYGHTLYVTTNGSLLTDSHKNSLPVDYWCISYRSATKDAFTHRRATLTYSEYSAGIARFIRDNTQCVVVYLMGNTEPHNIAAGFAGAIDLSDRLQSEQAIDRVGRSLWPEFAGLPAGQPMVERYIALRPKCWLFISRACNWANTIIPAGFEVLPGRPGPCPYDYYQQQIVVSWDGDVAPCCLDYNGDLAIGNLLEESLEDLLSRRQFQRNESLCLRCMGTVHEAEARRPEHR